MRVIIGKIQVMISRMQMARKNSVPLLKAIFKDVKIFLALLEPNLNFTKYIYYYDALLYAA